MSKSYEAVIFDLDGTLIDSMWVWKELNDVFFEKYAIVPPDNVGKELEGKSFTETAKYFKERFELEESIDEIKLMWNQIAMDFYTSKVPLKKGVIAFLDYLKTNQIKMGIATSNSVELATAVLEHLKIRSYFDIVRTSCEVEKGKPFPYVYLKVAEELDVRPENCLVFEDVPNGVRAGKSAGMEVWAIEDNQPEEMKDELQLLADLMVDHYEEALYKLKEKILGSC